MSKNKPVILVTGAKGQLAITLAHYAQHYPEYQWFFCKREQMDICDPKQVAKTFELYRPDYCINTAAFTNVSQAEEHPQKAIATNVNGVKILLENTNRYNCCLLHLSTDYVFDGQQSHPYLESDPVNPINIYGKTKAEGEQILLALAEKYYIVRTAWLYAKTHGQNFYRSILHKASAGKTLSVVNDQIGTPTSTDELAAFLMRMIVKSPENGIYHCAGQEILSRHDFAKAILKENQIELKLVESLSPKEGVQRPPYSALSTMKTI